MKPSTEREATKYIDQIIGELVRLNYPSPLTPSHVVGLAVTRIKLRDRTLMTDLAVHVLRQIARSRLNTQHHVLIQARALATPHLEFCTVKTIKAA
jgi:hypothetical protein